MGKRFEVLKLSGLNQVPSLISPFLVMTAGLFLGLPGQAFQYKLQTSLKPEQRIAVQDILKKAEDLLPLELKNNLSDVKIKFDQINSPDGNALGVTSSWTKTITINESLIKDIMAGPLASRATGRQHKTAYNEALATILHETVHVYDYANVHSSEEWDWIRKCDTTFRDEERNRQPRPFACRYYEKMHTSYSANPYFLQVAGWMDSSDNGFTQRSPDIYEVKDAKEYLAVNMEYFLMDPDYKCRRPGMYKLLSSQFKHIPFANVSCESQLGYVIPNSSYKMAQLTSIDPARVYQVHYLFAEKGSELMSGWGHAMIRLVICSPLRKEVGPECLRDVESHVVLSFRAFVDSMSTSTWAGLSGKYPSRLFILPMNQVIDEYNKGQFRALRSLPLRLNRQQINDLIARSVEVHWSYEGKYYFVSNNCATETLNLLQSVLLKPEVLFTEIKTPVSLYQTLIRLGLADESVLKDQKKALELGYYFDSYKPRYEKTFQIAKDNLKISSATFEDWLNLPASSRLPVIQSIKSGSENHAKVTAALFVLELAAQRQVQNEILTALQKILMQQMDAKAQQSSAKDAAGVVVNNYLELSQIFAKASSFLVKGHGYGLPNKTELGEASAAIDDKAQHAAETARATVKLTSDLTPDELLTETENVKTNIEMLQKILKEK